MTTTRQYDNLNRLALILSAAGGGAKVGSAYQYGNANQWTNQTLADNSYWVSQYDWQGRRIHKLVQNPTNGTISDLKFLYNGWNLVAELNATNNSVICSYMWGTDLSGSWQGAGGVGGLLAVDDAASGNGVHFAAFDGNGNVTALVRAGDGLATTRYEYGPFGEVIRATGPMAALNHLRWSTKYTDEWWDIMAKVGLSIDGGL